MKKILGIFKSKTSEKADKADKFEEISPKTSTATSTFTSLGLAEPLLKALTEQQYSKPTAIQASAIPLILAGGDLIGCAQTGTGKTAAFALPILNRLLKGDPQKRGIKALILTPTRELALQIAENCEVYGKYTQMKTIVVFGGVGAGPQRIALRANPDILVATPGRFLDLNNQGFIKLANLEVFVLDEADRMLDMGFIHDVKRIISLLPKPRQNLLFSATMPQDIQQLAMSFLVKPSKVAVTPVSSTSEQVTQFLYHVDRANKRHLLLHVLEAKSVFRAIVFTRTKAIANRVTEFLVKNDVSAEAIHGNKSQNARQRALENFKNSKTRILVASDIASRGIDVDDVTHVINYDIPNISETYVHRIGRTGRAHASGEALSFCDKDERLFIRDIEKLIGKKIPIEAEHPFPAGTAAPLEPIPEPSSRGGSRPPRGAGGGGHRSNQRRSSSPKPTGGGRGDSQANRGRSENRAGSGSSRSSGPSLAQRKEQRSGQKK